VVRISKTISQTRARGESLVVAMVASKSIQYHTPTIESANARNSFDSPYRRRDKFFALGRSEMNSKARKNVYGEDEIKAGIFPKSPGPRYVLHQLCDKSGRPSSPDVTSLLRILLVDLGFGGHIAVASPSKQIGFFTGN
jgi:hypothetical protein